MYYLWVKRKGIVRAEFPFEELGNARLEGVRLFPLLVSGSELEIHSTITDRTHIERLTSKTGRWSVE